MAEMKCALQTVCADRWLWRARSWRLLLTPEGSEGSGAALDPGFAGFDHGEEEI